MRDVVVVGGGLVGSACGLGMLRQGADVVIIEGDDNSFHASRGNFGLVWAQSKGARGRDYASWTRLAISRWRHLEDEIRQLSGIETFYRNGTGLHLCLSDTEFEKRAALINRVAAYDLPGNDGRMIDRKAVLDIVPGVGPDVVGASVSSMDGDCHSLALYRGLTASFVAAGGLLCSGTPVTAIEPGDGFFLVRAGDISVRGRKVLLAAGLATNALAAPFGFPEIVRPQKGEILVTERTRPFLPVVMSSLRQTPDGTVLIGDTKEEAGYDDRSTRAGMTELGRRAVRMFPELGQVRVVRSWAALRVLTPDGDPVYDESPTHPGLFVATTHSGVTLAPAHYGPLAQWITGGQKPPEFQSFKAGRFTSMSAEEQALAH